MFPMATRLWSSVCQIDHFPPHLWEWRDSPFSGGHPAWKRTVGDELSIWEDSGSLGLVNETVQLSWICPGVTRGWSGNPTMMPGQGEAGSAAPCTAAGPVDSEGFCAGQHLRPGCLHRALCREHGRPRRVVECLENLAVSGLEMSVCCMVTLTYSAVSGPARTLHTLVAVVSGVAMAYHPGAYAVQAAAKLRPVQRLQWNGWLRQGWHSGGPNGGCKTIRILRIPLHPMIALRHLEDTMWLTRGFKHVPAAWTRTLLPQVAAAAESSGSKDKPASWPAPKASMLKKSKMVQALRIRPGPDQPELSAAESGSLAEGFLPGHSDAPSRGVDP